MQKKLHYPLTTIRANLKKQILFLILFLGITPFLSAQTTLAAGNIAIIGFNSDEPVDRMTIVTLASISAGTTIYISDRYWDGNANAFITSNTTDGVITWTTTAAIPAGTVISFTITAGTPATVSGLPGTVSTIGNTAGVVASGGDNWFFFQGTSPTATPSSWVFGWANWSTPSSPTYTWASIGAVTTGTTSNLPTALTNNTNAIALTGSIVTSPTAQNPHYDNMYYSGPTTGTPAALLAAICTNSNWTGDEAIFQNITPGGGVFPTSFTLSTLPIELTTFEGKNYTNQNLLVWTTASESNNKGFDIEASQDGIRFDKIGFIKGNGTTNDVKRYSFTDEKVVSGLTYYRLRQVDFDDGFEYSKIISVLRKSDKFNVVSVSPNPATNILNIVVETKNDDDLEVNLLDVFGKTLKQQTTTTQQGLNNKSLNLQDLPNGIYFLQLLQGTEKVTRKIVKE